MKIILSFQKAAEKTFDKIQYLHDKNFQQPWCGANVPRYKKVHILETHRGSHIQQGKDKVFLLTSRTRPGVPPSQSLLNTSIRSLT